MACVDELEHINGIQSVCKKGCAACCKQCIAVISSEIPAIENYINGVGVDTKETIKQKTVEICAILTSKRNNCMC